MGTEPSSEVFRLPAPSGWARERPGPVERRGVPIPGATAVTAPDPAASRARAPGPEPDVRWDLFFGRPPCDPNGRDTAVQRSPVGAIGVLRTQRSGFEKRATPSVRANPVPSGTPSPS